MPRRSITLDILIRRIGDCRECEKHLPLGANPILRIASNAARVLIISHAPGTKVHQTGISWNDPSGVRLRKWMGVTDEQFYDQTKFANLPMGFCYPGKGKSGDNPPRPECAPLWHDQILPFLPNIRLTLLIGQYALERYLGNKRKDSLGQTVRAWREYIDEGYLPLVHPSPRNLLWLKRNPWFESEIVPDLQNRIHSIFR